MPPPALELPQCYLADLDPQAEITPRLVQEAWFALQRNHAAHLLNRSTPSIVQDIADAASLWTEPRSSYMRRALEWGPSQLGFSEETILTGLQQLFGSITVASLEFWIEQDLGHLSRLDTFCAVGAERGAGRRSKVVGPPTLAHIGAGNIPSSSLMSIVAGFLVRSAQFLKCPLGGSLVPRLFAHAVREVNGPLGSCIEIAEWSRARSDLTTALIEPAECVTATGGDEAVASVRNQLPVSKRFIAYGHKVSIAYVAADALVEPDLESIVRAAARDVSTWDQLGCLSPHVVYVEEGGAISAEQFAARLATALQAAESVQPRGPLLQEDASTIRSRRAFYEVRSAASSETKLWQSEGSTAWTVVYEAEPQFQMSCLNRFVYVKCAANLEAVLQGADSIRNHISTVGLAASSGRTTDLASRLAAWGATRICRIGSMQNPPLAWRHDGRPTLSSLVRWTDWEVA